MLSTKHQHVKEKTAALINDLGQNGKAEEKCVTRNVIKIYRHFLILFGGGCLFVRDLHVVPSE